MDPARARHWQEAWAVAGISRGRRDPGREKYYALVAYPGASGFLHVGHFRGLVYADAFARYQRARGRAVLFPFGLHASGIPAVTWAQKVHDRDPTTIAQLQDAGVDSSRWPALEDPEAAARFLGDEYRRVLRRFGILFDESTYVTTIDEEYRAFIRWQMRTLQSLGAIRQGPYFASVCPVEGPVAVDPSETDLSSGGTAEIVRFVAVPFRLEDGRTLLAATLRCETVFGVTNLWVAPDGELVVWHRGEQEYVVARPGGERLVEQHGGHLGRSVPVRELLGRTVSVPETDRSVPILTSRVVDPAIGTGIVMSVPAHSPADAAARAELPAEEQDRLVVPPVLIEIPAGVALTASEEALREGEGTPAERALRAAGARSLADARAVEQAIERLYRLEFVRGRMTVPGWVGIPVREARERIEQELLASSGALELREFSEPVICRNGHTVIIRRVPDQWFLRYGDPEWKAETRQRLARFTGWPDEYGRELPGIIDWFDDRPATRKGRWLGTPFPLDPSWIVEPIADSTFYMAYYIVRRFVADGRLDVGGLTDAFFDRVFRGVGPGEPALDSRLQDEVRAEFEYWYPLDLNIGGKEHKSVHFPVFLFTHARLLPPELFPRGIFVHGWITGTAGAKISKKEVSSKGGRIPPTDSALDRWGPDALRLQYATAAAPASDFEWDPETVDAALTRLNDIERLVRETRGSGGGPPELDAWLSSRVHGVVERATQAMDRADPRAFAEEVYVALPTAVRRYYARGGVASDLTDRVGRAWIRLLGPITPHLAEELGEGYLPGLVAALPFPDATVFPRAPVAEAREEYLARVEEDLRAVLRPAKGRVAAAPDEVAFFVASSWKATVESWIREEIGRGVTPTVGPIMDRARTHAELAAHLRAIPKYVQRVAPLLRSEPAVDAPSIDELATLREAEAYLCRRLGFSAVVVVPEDQAASIDPLGRRERSRPRRPAFYLISHGRAPRDAPPPGARGDDEEATEN